MSADRLYRYIARIVIEFKTPFLVAGGRCGMEADAAFVADANGLPTIPGSSIAGALRDAFSKTTVGKEKTPDGIKNVDDLFGFQLGASGNGSRLTVSWACIHDSRNVPVEGLIPETYIESDPVLKLARLAVPRPHVKINDKGGPEDKGLFHEIHVAAGNRFTFELMLEGSDKDDTIWETLLNLVRSIRLGGKTRRGYGSFSATIHQAAYDLTTPAGFEAFCKHPVSFRGSHALQHLPKQEGQKGASHYATATLALVPEGFWMIGGGVDPEADMSPMKEMYVSWPNDIGTVSERFVIPGSSVKGVLAHRVAFHYNALSGKVVRYNNETGKWEKPQDENGASPIGESNEAVRQLFGECLDHGVKGEQKGRRGRVMIDDCYLPAEPVRKILNHVSIDRYTAGSRDGMLFNERPFYKGEVPALEITFDTSEEIDKKVRVALERALDDLVSGRLAIGSGTGRGNGFFGEGSKVEWNTTGKAWIGGER